MTRPGTAALEEGGRVDFAALRAERRARLLAAMERHGLDACVLGREHNARFAAGARRLWTAGTRPFAPGCVIVRETGAVHLLSTWDEGVPPEVPREHLYGITWNPANYGAVLARIPGLAACRRIGVDGMTPLFAQIIAGAAPAAELVDATPALTEARRVKSPTELDCIRTAIAIAEGAVAEAAAALRPGVAERALAGRFLAAAARLGAPTPAMEGTFCVTADAPPLRLVPTDRAVMAGEAVAVRAGVLYAGYEGLAGRTLVCPGAPNAAAGRLAERAEALRRRLLAAVGPGATGTDLLAAHVGAGEAPPPFPVAFGLGLGAEPPVVAVGRPPADDPLEPGMVLAVQACVAEPGAGAWLTVDVVAVTPDGAEVLSR